VSLVVVMVMVVMMTLAIDEVGSSPVSFFHLSDLHIDINYVRSADPSTFCRGSGTSSKSVKKCKSSGSVQFGSNLQYGQFLCDAPLSLLQSTLISMKTVSRVCLQCI